MLNILCKSSESANSINIRPLLPLEMTETLVSNLSDRTFSTSR